MQYWYRDLGNLKKGQIVVVTLRGDAPNVRLMDSSNFSAYKRGKRHHFYGGNAKKSPVRIVVPRNAHWYIAIDFGGLAGKVRWGVSVESGALPAIRENSTLAASPIVVRDETSIVPDETGRIYDVFISHASEDKDAVARPLANALVSAGLTVWYDEFEMHMGDSLRRKIDHGLAHSRFGVVVISRDFIKKGWPNYELDGIITRTVAGEQVMLPIWHNITRDEVVSYSPTLADKIARNTANDSVDDIANEIIELIASRDM